MATFNKIQEIYQKIAEKQSVSGMYAKAIADITASTNSDGDVELEIQRTKKKFTIPANGLITSLTNKKDNIDQQITNLLDKVTIT